MSIWDDNFNDGPQVGTLTGSPDTVPIFDDQGFLVSSELSASQLIAAASLTSLDVVVEQNTSDILTLQSFAYSANTQIVENTLDIFNLNATVDSIALVVTADTADIAGLQVTVASVSTHATANTSAITGLTTTVNSVAAVVTANTASIAALQVTVVSVSAHATANTSAITGLTTTVNSVATVVTTNTADIASHLVTLNSVAVVVTTNTANIATNLVTLNSVATVVTTNTANIATNLVTLNSVASVVTTNTAAIAKFTSVTTDSTSTGSTASLQAGDLNFGIVRLTNGSLTGISGIPAGTAGQFLTVENKSGNTVVVKNQDAGVTAANRIYTGSGTDLNLVNNATLIFVYDAVSGSWMVAGGSASATSTPTASTAAAWDANKNFSANNFLDGYATTVTALGTTTLTVSSAAQQYFTGSSNQNVALPVAATLVSGQTYEINNNSSGILTVQTSGGNTVQAMATNTSLLITCINTGGGTGTASWSWTYGSSNSALPMISPMTTKGDVITGGTSGVPTRHAVPNDYGRVIADQAQTDGWRSEAYTETQGKPGKNYIQYADFENGATTGWSVCTTGTLTNGLPTGSPTFGSGTTGLVLSASASTPIAGVYSLTAVQSSASTAGNGFCTSAYPIDQADQARVLSFKFNYLVTAGGTNLNFSGTSSNSIAVACYDVTNSSWIPVVGAFNLVQGTGVGVASGTLQTNATTASLRFVVYFPNASGGSFSAKFDDFYLGPQALTYGAAMTDWVSYTPTGSWVSNTTYTGKWRRVGDAMEVQFLVSCTGAPTATSLSVNLPSGYTADLAKVAASTLPAIFGQAEGYDGGSGYIFSLYLSTSTSVGVGYISNGTTSIESNVTNTAPFTFGSGKQVNGTFKVPITGWSSNTVQSSDTATNVVKFIGSLSSGSNTTSGTAQTISTWITTKDSNAAFSSGTTYTVPVTGYYDVNAVLNIAANTTGIRYIQAVQAGSASVTVTGTTIAGFTGTGNATSVIASFYCSAGDTITIQSFQNSGGTLAYNSGNLVIQRTSGPATVQATESVNASYSTTVGTTVGTSLTTIPFATKYYDSHNAWNTTNANAYAVPVAGKYRISVVLGETVNISTSQIAESAVIQAGSTSVTKILALLPGVGVSQTYGLSGSATFNCLAGDTLTIQALSSVSGVLNTTAGLNHFEIERVGN